MEENCNIVPCHVLVLVAVFGAWAEKLRVALPSTTWYFLAFLILPMHRSF